MELINLLSSAAVSEKSGGAPTESANAQKIVTVTPVSSSSTYRYTAHDHPTLHALEQTAASSGSPKAGDRFLPGTLNMTRTQALQQCFTDPQYYSEHFDRNNFCTLSHQHKLMYLHIPKSGSSTSRDVVNTKLAGVDNQHCLTKTPQWKEYNKVSIVREPTNRFGASYDEMFARTLSHKHVIPAQFRAFSEGLADYKSYEAIFGTREVTDRFELWAALWDGRRVFDNHIRLQVPVLSSQDSGLAHPLAYVGYISEMKAAWEAIGKLVGKEIDEKDVIRGRSFPRRFNETLVSAKTWRKICQHVAQDYCCLNFPLPAPCLEVGIPDAERTYCKWTQRPELAAQNDRASDLFIEAVRPV
ncbi:hypothetical protein CYMTET_45889 [Cymbomonas tetramitiformis]|uniref:Uncharacterized protein n=1 Tax=Cymbomonas tetramitiformis TaxID=36881 RepID=A0AAE0EZ84_9CHLO|nr:hypothetical protein CYMTET_45889 [Cymbomonas tetramitiformis]